MNTDKRGRWRAARKLPDKGANNSVEMRPLAESRTSAAKWKIETAEAIDASNRWVEENGLPLESIGDFDCGRKLQPKEVICISLQISMPLKQPRRSTQW